MIGCSSDSDVYFIAQTKECLTLIYQWFPPSKEICTDDAS